MSSRLADASANKSNFFMLPLVKAMRPKQWVKNVFVFAGIVFARDRLLLQPEAIAKTILAFAFFCLTSSAVYLINDLVDKEQDQQHPTKKFRPIASGDLAPETAVIFALLFPLFSIGASLVLAISTLSVDVGWLWFAFILVVYLALQVAYSFSLKHIVLVDLFAITAGFILRAIGGALVISESITVWWLLCVFFLALFLGLGKRRNELHLLAAKAGEHRDTLQEYSFPLLDQLLMIDVACTIMVYSQATFTSTLASSMSYPFLVLTVPVVVFALFRYLYLIVQKGEGGEPADILMRDRPLESAILLCVCMVLFIQIMGF